MEGELEDIKLSYVFFMKKESNLGPYIIGRYLSNNYKIFENVHLFGPCKTPFPHRATNKKQKIVNKFMCCQFKNCFSPDFHKRTSFSIKCMLVYVRYVSMSAIMNIF